MFSYKAFIACIIATFTQTLGINWYHGDYSRWKGTIVDEFYGFFRETTVGEDKFQLLVAGLIMGTISGMLGAFFININTRLNYIRRRHLTTKVKKTVETACFCAFTGAVVFFTPYFFNRCIEPTSTTHTDAQLQIYRGWCGTNGNGKTLINPLSAYFWVPEAYYEANVLDNALELDLQL